MFRSKIYIDLHETGVLSEITEMTGGPFAVYEEQMHEDDTVTFRIDAGDHRDDFYSYLTESKRVIDVSRVNENHLLIRKRAMGALPIIRANHGKTQGIDSVYSTRRILDVIVFRSSDLRRILEELRDVGEVSLGALHPVGSPTDALTDKQRTVMRTALEEGYYEWPRSLEARELADRLEISHSTLLEHLRKAERKLLEASFEEESTSLTAQEREFLLSGEWPTI